MKDDRTELWSSLGFMRLSNASNVSVARDSRSKCGRGLTLFLFYLLYDTSSKYEYLLKRFSSARRSSRLLSTKRTSPLKAGEMRIRYSATSAVFLLPDHMASKGLALIAHEKASALSAHRLLTAVRFSQFREPEINTQLIKFRRLFVTPLLGENYWIAKI